MTMHLKPAPFANSPAQRARRLLQCCGLAGLLCAGGVALAQPGAGVAAGAMPAAAVSAPSAAASAAVQEAPPELKEALPQGKFIGRARLKVWGFDVYDARLWAGAGFAPANPANTALALELAYLRDFKAEDIADRSLKEMRRSQPIGDAQANQWKAEMLRVFPDVRKGDRILGAHRPGVGASFWVNGKASDEIRDAEFSRLFFGIWLSPKTSEPSMRAALLGGQAGHGE
ncbi:MAG: hypothetical protein JWR60_2794 [Polaromonas sp.]|nr:hypothetical protein [Polaromonas sp.]